MGRPAVRARTPPRRLHRPAGRGVRPGPSGAHGDRHAVAESRRQLQFRLRRRTDQWQAGRGRGAADPPTRPGSAAAEEPARGAVAGRLRAAAVRLVAAQRRGVGQDQPDARVGHRPAVGHLRTGLPAHPLAAVLLRPRPHPGSAQAPRRRRRQPRVRRRPQGTNRRGGRHRPPPRRRRLRPTRSRQVPPGPHRRADARPPRQPRRHRRRAHRRPSPGPQPRRRVDAAHPPIPRRAHRPVPDRHPAAGHRRRLPTRRARP